MPETLSHVSTQITEKWNGIEKKNKMKIIAIVVALVLIIAASVMIFNKPKMAPLFKNLESKQASQVTELLDKEAIPYKLQDDGNTILVDNKDVNKAKLLMAKENIPKGRYAFEDALNNSMSTTESEKKVKLHKVNENELAVALETLEYVESAQVKLVVPSEDNSFLESKQKSSAAVILELSQPLTNKQINGIANFVSRSVKNLDIADINIIDTEGNNLYIGSEASLEGGYSEQREQKLFAEQNIKNKVAELMEKMYDDVRISPNLVFDYDQYVETKETYESPIEDSNKGIVIGEKTSDSSSTNTQDGAEPGNALNTAETPEYALGGNNASNSKNKTREATYAIDKTISNKTKGVGKIDVELSSIAVHVFQDKIYKQEEVEKRLEPNQTWEEFKEQNGKQVALAVDEALIDSVKKATGLQNVAVQSFENPVFMEQEPFKLSMRNYIPYGLLIAFLILLGYGIYKFTSPKEIIELEPELSVEEMLQTAKKQQQEPLLEEIEYNEEMQVKKHIEKFVDEKPDAVANLLRNWLADDDWE